MAGARFSQINLVAHDVPQTLAFYRRLGLEIPAGGVWEIGGHAHHATSNTAGDVDLEFDSRRFAQVYNRGFAAERGRVVIGIALESREAVDALWADLLAEGAQGLQPPYDTFWGARYAIVEDPDGNPVGLMSPVDPTRRSAPPEL
ncbi:MAG TPA: VOC family protein [Caulobacteraceae bacterium]|nr:VOC family protein [Caulobacteraceae bacterium]